MRLLVMVRARAHFEYDKDWRDALARHPGVQVEIGRYAPERARTFVSRRVWRAMLRADAIVLLHSADPTRPGRRHALFRRLLEHRRGKLAYFVRNEYKDFVPRRRFIREAGVDLVCSQLDAQQAQHLYGDLARVISLPHAANFEVYESQQPLARRRLNVGSRTAPYPPTLLDDSRNRLAQLVQAMRARRPGWAIDYSDRAEDRFDRAGWAAFLASSRYTISTEAGAAYLDPSDALQRAIERFVDANPGAGEAEIMRRFAPRRAGLPDGRAISSRHFEAIASGTAQVLVRGRYAGVLEPDAHYIPLERDFSNLDAVLDRMDDLPASQAMVSRALAHVRENHCHRHRIAALISALA